MRLIDADHLRRWILSRVFNSQLSVADVIDQIDREDTIEPERKKGEWIEDIAYYDEEGCPCIVTRCNQCGAVHPVSNFCHQCGADMRQEGEQDDE